MSNLFFAKKKSPAGSSTPEELDHLLVVVRSPLWIPLGALAFVCACAVVWSIFGRIPISVSGVGVLITPGNVQTVQSQESGLVSELRVSPGQDIQKGDVVAVLMQPMSEQSVNQARENYNEIKQSNEKTLGINDKRFADLMDSFRRKEEILAESKKLSASVHAATQRRYDALKSLAEDGLARQDQILGAESSFAESQTKMSNYGVQLQQLKVDREQARQQNNQTEFQLRTQMDEARRKLEQLELQLKNSTSIRSSVSGKVLEVMVSVGRTVSYATPIITLETLQDQGEMLNLCFFPVKDGKRIRRGMQVLLTPTTVKRERFGGMIGKVTKVSAFPITREAAINRVGSKELTSSLMSDGAMIEVEVKLTPAKNSESVSQYEWSSKNPPVAVNQGMVTMDRIAIEERAPITYLMPLLRSWFQGQKDDFAPGI
ncbi:NHLP bacteriocin system secretion protein [Verrucomicrobia bacterium]|nr:NHLP bacteriocin system secretion protein [Verrucomicrobiota bacterium]